MDNLEKIYNLINKSREHSLAYKAQCLNLLHKIVELHFDALYKYEDLENNDLIEIKIESINKTTIDDIKLCFRSLFEVNTTSGYLLAINKLQGFLEKCQIKGKIDKQEKKDKINYNAVQYYLEKEIANMINSISDKEVFHYYINPVKEESKEEVENMKNISTNLIKRDIEYLNLCNIPILLDMVLSKLPKIKVIIENYSLMNIQQIDFSLEQYNAIKDCFKKIKNSRISRLDINDVIKVLDDADSDDYYDVFSEAYVTFVATLLECVNLICYYYLVLLEPDNKTKTNKHKDYGVLKNYIKHNINIYLDKLYYENDINIIDLYILLYNKVNNFKSEEIITVMKSL